MNKDSELLFKILRAYARASRSGSKTPESIGNELNKVLPGGRELSDLLNKRLERARMNKALNKAIFEITPAGESSVPKEANLKVKVVKRIKYKIKPLTEAQKERKRLLSRRRYWINKRTEGKGIDSVEGYAWEKNKRAYKRIYKGIGVNLKSRMTINASNNELRYQINKLQSDEWKQLFVTFKTGTPKQILKARETELNTWLLNNDQFKYELHDKGIGINQFINLPLKKKLELYGAYDESGAAKTRDLLKKEVKWRR